MDESTQILLDLMKVELLSIRKLMRILLVAQAAIATALGVGEVPRLLLGLP